MSPAPKRPRLRHVLVRLRVSVDPQLWSEMYGVEPSAVVEDVRRYAVRTLQESPAAIAGAIVSGGVRRDRA